MTRSATSSSGQFDAFPLGGQGTRLSLNAQTWTEFDPDGADLVRIQTPGLTGATRIIYTDTTDVPGLVDSAAVTSDHRDVALEFYIASTEDCCFDRSGTETRFFFALADTATPDETVSVLFKRAAK